MAGIKGRSGRHRSISSVVGDALNINDRFIGDYLSKLREIALNPSDGLQARRIAADCLMYLINRSQGSPKAAIDMRMKADINISADELLAKVKEVRLLEQQVLVSATVGLLEAPKTGVSASEAPP